MHATVRRSAAALSLVALAVACGSEDEETASGDAYAVTLAADEYTFRADEAIEIRAGDTVTFEVRNIGVIDHRLEVLSEESRSLGATDRIAPGSSDRVTVTFESDGVYRVICDIDDHLTRGQQARFEVLPPA